MVRRAPALVLVSLLLAGVGAAAQPPVDEARAAYEAGVAHLLASRFQEAALSLERSYALRAVPIARYNLALAYRGLGRYRAAIPLFDEYLRSGAAELTPERVAAIRAERDDLARALVDATLRVTPADAVLRIDGGDPVPSPTTLTLDPGAHVLEWTAPAHHPHRESLTATPGAHPALTVALDPVREGRLLVESSVPSSTLLLDGARVAAGRFDREVPVGEHTLTVRADGYRPVQRRVSVSPAGTVRVVITLEREGPPGWVLPTAIVGGVAVLGGILAGVLVATQPDPPTLRSGSLGTFRE
jgi:hypothetical protein